ncbi:MAG TPA: FAD-dependent oxidoreductase [Solirubrobacteraceae bacterium]|jgi:4-methylaminobutanoate oxidase (formaldehyde-forming)|nr:FAD-dependent oxidoreductase [Solirubrobacteraceae bacterium]
MPRPRELPDRARIVIIGGGVGGAAIAYHLAQLGERDVILLDRNELTSGSTFHSAGLVGQLRGSVSLTRMMMDSVALYRELDCGWVECGGIRLACTPEREQEVLRQVAWARTFGLPLELIGPEEAQSLFPLMITDGVRCGSYLPTDGYLDPSQLTYALVEGAREGGVRIFTHTRVTGIDVSGGRVRGVETEWGNVEADIVVNAGGMYAAEVGRLAGVRVPLIPFAHEYLVTQPFRERARAAEGEFVHLPTLRDPDLLIYFREEGAGLVMGGYERHSAPWALDAQQLDRIPSDFNGRLLEEDWQRFEEIAENSRRRVPLMEDVKVTRLINGPEAFTPDNEFCLGESDVRGFFVAAGFCAHGIAGAGGMGRLMAEWIVAGEPGLDVWEMDIRRFGPQYRSPRYTLKRTKEVYETYYDIRYPGHERRAGRPLRLPPAYQWHADHAASFGEKSGWERVNWYESNAAEGDESLRPRGWAGMHWSPAVGAEAMATRDRAGLFDESSFSKLELAGPGAAGLLERLCDNRVARDVGQITYTQMLNRHGGIECDFTVTRVAEELFQIVTGTAFGQHDASWIRRQLPDDGSVALTDVTSRWACFGLWGPRARDVLAPLTPDPLDFGYMRMRELTVGDVPVRALRVTYVGEFGWELYCPSEYGLGLWRTLWESGAPLGLVAGGYRAIDSLRLEKGYRAWAADITPDDSPHEAGLQFCVAEGKVFNGSAALRERPVLRRLRCITLSEPRAVALGNEPVRIAGEVVGRVTSGGYGYAVQRSIAYAYLPPDAEPGAEVEIDIFGEWLAGEITAEPLYDPEGSRLRD